MPFWRKEKKLQLPEHSPVIHFRTGKVDFNEAAVTHIDAVKKIFGIKLDLDEASIFKLDGIIEEGWKDIPEDQIDYELNALMFGSFLGAAVITTLGGRWVESEWSIFGWAVEFPVEGGEPCMAFTHNKALKRFQNGMEDSISFFYHVIKKQAKGEIP